MNAKEKGLPKDFGSAFQDGIGVRLRNLEAFVYLMIDKEREFATYEVEDENGVISEHTITEMAAFGAFFGRCDDIEDTVEELKKNVSDRFRESAEVEQQVQEAQERQSKRVAEYKASEAIKAKELEVLKVEGAKKRRAAYEIEHAEELRKIAQKKQEKEEYEQALKSAKEDGKDVYLGGRTKKLD